MTARRVRFVSYRSATIHTIRTVRELAGIEALAKLDAGEWIELELDAEAEARLDALAERGVEFELYEPPPPPPAVEPPAPVEVPRDLDLLAALRYPEAGGGGVRAARLLASSFEHIELRAAIELTRTGGEVATGLTLAEAEAHAAAFAELGVRVEIVLATDWTYAFDPRDPAGADQVLERMRVIGPELVVERGTLARGKWTEVSRARSASAEAHDAALAAQHEAWRAAGREWTETPAELVEALRAREPRLEAEIRAAEDPRPHIAVYTDWLRERGDPLGRLVEAAARGEKAFFRALAEHEVHLFWPLGQAREHARLRWAHGLVHGLGVELPKQLDEFETSMDFVSALLDLPCCAGLRELELRAPTIEITRDSVIEALPGIRKLVLDGGLTGDVIVSDWSRLRRVELLELRAHHPKLAPIVLPKLRRLRLRYDRLENDGVEAFEQAELGALERLELVGEDRAERAHRLERVLASPALATVHTARIEVHVGRIGEATIDAIVDSRLYRSARVIELVAELDKDAEAAAGRAAPTLRVDPGPRFPWD